MIHPVPTHCPHGVARAEGRVGQGGRYFADGCWTALSAGAPRLFWVRSASEDSFNEISITAGEYLAAWNDAVYEEHVRESKKAAFARRNR